ncbi:DUF4335 domain-containing protein [Moorena bouillonii]|uniref:DUF4335 domain-containing protein n=1 Tax=Moorena bouillonii PNG TaxID=568701 RepID=A0A1U7MWQ7_9CYAN|nr:DUF4335 domain-containing protein [Moorena bouillonii]OLT58133.1 hypothetical protein BJP37_02820 [Moorena bouillonii PNG]
MTNIVLRRYTPPTCTLSIRANRSPLSRWVGQSVVKKLRFELRFDDPRKPEEQQVTLRGNAEDLDVLYEAVDGYVQHFLEPSPNQLVASGNSSAEVTPLTLLTLPTPQEENATAVPTQHIHLQSKGLLSHSLFLGKLANQESGSVVDLSATQLFDLATALDEYAAEVVSLPKLNQPSWKPESSAWMRTAASMVLAVGVTAAVIKLLEKPQPVEQGKTLTTEVPTTALESSKIGKKRAISQVPPAPSTPIPTPSVPPRLSPGTKLPPPPPVKPPSPPVRTPPPPPVKPPSPPVRTAPPIASRPNSRPILTIVPPPARKPDSPQLSATSPVASSVTSPVASSVTSPIASSAVSPAAAPGASNGEAPVSEASKTNVTTAKADTQPKPTPPSPIAVVQTVSELPVIKPAPSPTEVGIQDSSRESLSISKKTVVIPEAESSISPISTTSITSTSTSTSSTTNVAVQAIPAPQQNVSTLDRGSSTSKIIDQAVPGLNLPSSPVIDQAVPGLNVPSSPVSDSLNPSEPTVANQISQNTLLDKISQVAEARRYFQERWQPPEGLQKTLNYSLWLNNNGTIRRIIPLGQAAKTYIDNAPIPLIGESFVSPLEAEGMPKIRVLLHPDGKVQTLLEGMN